MTRRRATHDRSRPRRRTLAIGVVLVLAGLGALVAYLVATRGKASPAEAADHLTRLLDRLGHKVARVAPPGAGGLPAPAATLRDWQAVSGLAAALNQPDEAMVREALRQAGLKGLLVSRDFVFRDRPTNAVLNRFIKLRFCERFNAALMAERWVLYALRTRPEYTPVERQALMALARGALREGQMPKGLTLPERLNQDGRATTEVLLTIWQGHRYAALGRSRHRSPVRAVLKAAERAAAKWARRKKRGPLAEALPDLTLQLDLVYDRGKFVDRTDRVLFHGVEMGLAGLALTRDKQTKVLPPGYAVWFGKEYYTKLLKSLNIVTCGRTPKDGASAKRRERYERCRARWDWHDSELTFRRFTSVSFRERSPGGPIFDVYRGVPLIRTDELSRPRLLAALELGADNLANSIYPDGPLWPHGHRHEKKIAPEPGKSVYRFSPVSDYYSKDYNMVRHVLVPYSLARSYQHVAKPRYLEAARASLDWLAKKCRWEEDRAFPFHNNNAKMGAAGIAAHALAEYGTVTELTPEQETLLRGIGNHMVWMQDPNGHFKHYHVPPGHPYHGRETTIFHGEILLGLSRVYGHTKDPKYRESFERGAAFYYQYFTDTAAERRDDGTYSEGTRIDLLQFTPWFIMAMTHFYGLTQDEKYAKWGLEVAHWAVDMYEVLPPRAFYPDHVGAFWQREREQPAMHGCVYTEGAAAAIPLARALGDERAVKKFRNATLWGSRFALQLQYRIPESTFYVPHPERAAGAFRYSVTDDHVRIDYTYHAMSALSQALDYLQADEFSIAEPPPDIDVVAAFPEQ